MRCPSLISARTLAVALMALLPVLPARAADRPASPDEERASYATPYVYQNVGAGQPMSVTAQYELGYGSRESRTFTQVGIEQGARLRFQPWQRFGVEAFGGVVLDAGSGGYRSFAASVEGLGRVLIQSRHHLNLDLGAGYIYDYRGDHVPRLRLTLGRSFGRLDLSLSALLEIPVGGVGRDGVDVITTVAASYRVVARLRLGFEVAAEDLEGLTGRNEAEGGAKLLCGPTLAITLPHGLFLKLNTAAVYAWLSNQTYAAGARRPDEWGVMARAVVGWSWH
ncbi:MAG: hypothetical protein HY906_10335 [Deltaproteobacteria bacterium]|nr:hypothetical protein [Deltaproteobacteria bacterium]